MAILKLKGNDPWENKFKGRRMSISAGLVALALVATIDGPVVCLQDAQDKESSNSFLIRSADAAVLIDAGWKTGSQPPEEFNADLIRARKISTHFHYDHIRQWFGMEHIFLSTGQQARCSDAVCEPSFLDTVYTVPSFRVEGNFQFGDELGAGVTAVACAGHSRTDACYLHAASRTLFLGDIFYPGPLFAFLPGGSVSGIHRGIATALANPAWDRLGLTHGDCFLERKEVEKVLASLEKVLNGATNGEWNFEFMLPLKVYPLETGSIFTWPFFKRGS